MAPIIMLTLVAASSVAAILVLLHRLGRFQHSDGQHAPTSLFFRRWSYILKSENYTDPGRRLLPWLRLALGVLAISVVAVILSLVSFVQH